MDAENEPQATDTGLDESPEGAMEDPAFDTAQVYDINQDGYNGEEEDEFDVNASLDPFSSRQRENVSSIEEEPTDDYGYLPGVDDLPLFATKEAKKIDASNKEAETQLEAIVEELRDMNERIKVMKEHFKNVQQEVEHTNALYVSKQAEIHTESHLNQLSIRAVARGRSETKTLQDELDVLQAQLNNAQNEIYKANEKLDEFKYRMKWNQEELEKWAIAAKQKDDDAAALEKYARADENKIKELTLAQEQLTKEMQVL